MMDDRLALLIRLKMLQGQLEATLSELNILINALTEPKDDAISQISEGIEDVVKIATSLKSVHSLLSRYLPKKENE